VTVEIEELESANGLNDTPLWISIKGRVYDVTAGSKFYGVGKPYYKFVGRDATRAFCTGCMEPECLISNLDGLTEYQLREADRWLE
jgi:membrane-associated progesterone receptor component